MPESARPYVLFNASFLRIAAYHSAYVSRIQLSAVFGCENQLSLGCTLLGLFFTTPS